MGLPAASEGAAQDASTETPTVAEGIEETPTAAKGSKAKEKKAERKRLAEERKKAKQEEMAEKNKMKAEKQKKNDEAKAAAIKKKNDEHAAGHRAHEEKRQAEQAKKKAKEDKERADRDALFDSYDGPRVLDHKSQTLISVKFSPDPYKIKLEKAPPPTNQAEAVAGQEKNKKINSVWAVLRQQYPKECAEIRTEFDERREGPKLQKRLLEDANNVGTTYRAISNTKLSSYDFDRQGYSLGYTNNRAGIILDKGQMGSIFLPMGPDRAEQYQRDCSANGCKFYVETVYEVIDVTPHLLSKIKSFRIYKESVSATGKETILSGLVIEVPTSKLEPNPSYVQSGGEPDSRESETNMNMSF